MIERIPDHLWKPGKKYCTYQGHYSSHVMVWLGVHWRESFTKVYICEMGVKTNGKVYCKILDVAFLP